MKVLIFGATGMVGQGVLRECLLDSSIDVVTTVGRTGTGIINPKLRDIQQSDLWKYDSLEKDLSEFDACFFCLGVSSAGMNEKDYSRLNYELPLVVGNLLVKTNPNITFIYVSGEGTDSTEKGKVMWARVKGKTENELLKLFPKAYMFRPGMIEPMNGAVSKTTSYRILYAATKPLMPLLHMIMPKYITTTENVGKAMIRVAKKGYSKKILSNTDINGLGRVQ